MSSDSKYILWDHPDVEYGQGPEEEKDIDEICKLINESQRRVFNEHHHAFTGTHVKTHGVVKGSMEILPNLPKHLSQSMFSNGGKVHPIAIRFSTETSNLVPDHQPQPRGLGMKVFEVEGEKMYSENPNSKTQDFEFNSAPAIELGNAKVCKEILSLRLQFPQPKEHQEQLKKRDDYEVQNARNEIPNEMLLTQKQYSQSAFRFGNYVAKFAIFPSENSPQMKQYANDKVDESKEDVQIAHRERLINFFMKEEQECLLDFKVQLLQNLKDQKIEDCRIDWSEKDYPFETIAKIKIHSSQNPFLSERINFWRDKIIMNPWNGRKDLKPLGSINRLRKKVYSASANFRRKTNGNLTAVDVQNIDQIPDQ